MKRLALLIACVAALTGCASRMGAKSLPGVRMDYTEAVASSAEEQMLANLVRMRHGRLPVFLQVSSIVTQYGLTTNVGASAAGNAVGPGGFVPPAGGTVSTGVVVEERPTISYTPLQGEAFVRRLATPLVPETLAELVHAGWPWDAVLDCCVQQVNGLHAPSSPWRVGRTDFQRLGEALRRLQESHVASIRTEPDGRSILVLAETRSAEAKRDVAAVRRLLELSPDTTRVPIVGDGQPQSMTVHGRSMLGTLYYLSEGVEGPRRDRPSLGRDALLRVRNAKRPPKDA